MRCRHSHTDDQHGPCWIGTKPGQARRVLARLWRDRCPVCPEITTTVTPAEGLRSPRHACSCCGSEWSITDSDAWECAPGAGVLELPDHRPGAGARARQARARTGQLPGTVEVSPDRLYDAGEVAELIGVQRSSVARMVNRGSWPAADRRIGDRPAWYGSTIEHAVTHRRRRGRPPTERSDVAHE
jgi:predicted DNA-binding transcriptional regulator AlpA